MRYIQIQWDAESIQHIWQHQVHPEEIEEVLQGRYRVVTARDMTDSERARFARKVIRR